MATEVSVSVLVGQAMGESLGVGNRGWDFSEGLRE